MATFDVSYALVLIGVDLETGQQKVVSTNGQELNLFTGSWSKNVDACITEHIESYVSVARTWINPKIIGYHTEESNLTIIFGGKIPADCVLKKGAWMDIEEADTISKQMIYQAIRKV